MAGSPHVLSGTFAGRYTIERELGHGATATVYLARDTQRGRSVAIKVLRPELAESVGADRFLREIKVHEQLQHPHIVSVLDSGQHEGQLYCVLPYMEGGSLRQLLDREKQLPIDKAIAIARTIAEALHYAHSKGLIHRDVKPENILFSSGQACLADFGIARAIERAIDASTTETGLVRGTPAYMSPEQASGSRQYDGRSDQYSLACVLYEVLAGMQAFIGPTAEMIIAQRFQHTPRELRVYRPSVPKAVELVIVKALSLSPADRFANAAEFSAALDAALHAPLVEPRTSGPTVWPMARPRRIALIGAALFAIGAVGVIALTETSIRRRLLPFDSELDTNRVVVLPFQGASASEGSSAQELFHVALRSWRGLSLVPLDQTAEAIRRVVATGGTLTASQSRTVATTLSAGRYVVGRVMRNPTGDVLLAEFRDVDAGVLYSAQVGLPGEPRRMLRAYAALADSLVLRGAANAGPAREPNATRSLLATQLFVSGLDARDHWRVSQAESLFSRAAVVDPNEVRPSLWLAQVRQWAGQPADAWISAAERASTDSMRLDERERRMLDGLLAIARSDFPRARQSYEKLIARDSRSFAGWYGLGEANRLDEVVVADKRSPSGWRFRSSYESAIRAYTRAFEIVPATYLGFQADGYEKLRSLLFIGGNRLQRGFTNGAQRQDFFAAPTLAGDTIVMIPRPRNLVLQGKVRAIADPAAIERLRSNFKSIAARWASAFPQSPSAKEALAISLELQADRAALDTMRAAERLATDSLQRVRLAVARIVLQIKFSAPESASVIQDAVNSADSLLQVHANPAAKVAKLTAPVAALLGQCERTSSLLRAAAAPIDFGDIKIGRDVTADTYATLGYALAGCDAPVDAPSVTQLSQRLVLPQNQDGRRRTAEYVLLGPLVRARMPRDSAWIDRFADVGGFLFAAQRDALLHQPASARSRLAALQRLRSSALPGDVTADVVFPEAGVWLQLGDSAAAIATVNAFLAQLPASPPLSSDLAPYNSARLGFLSQSIALSALLNARREPAVARRSARAALALWSKADPTMSKKVAALRSLTQ